MKTTLIWVALVSLAWPSPATAAGDNAQVIARQQNDAAEAEATPAVDWREKRGWFVRGGVSKWTAIFGSNFGLGFGATGGYAGGLTDRLLLRVHSGAFRWSADAIDGARPGATASMTLVPLAGGVDYLVTTSGNITPYVGGSGGVALIAADFEDLDASFFEYDDITTLFPMAEVRAGVLMARPQSRFDFDAALRYALVIDSLPEFNMGDPATHDAFGVTAGIIWKLDTE